MHDEPKINVTTSTSALIAVADGVWIVEDAINPAGAVRVPIRMTVIRLSSGDLILHSPTPYSEPLRLELEQLGRIRYLLAPSVAHWMFVPAWQRALPQAKTFAVPGLCKRRQAVKAGLRVDDEVLHETPVEWQEDLESVLINASVYSELALFHKPSRTLVLTDLVQNFRPGSLPRGIREVATLLGVTAPHGRAPVYPRLLVRLGGRGARLAGSRLVSLAPQRVIFAHGEGFEANAAERLRQSLVWLVDPGHAKSTQGAMIGLRVVSTGASSGIGRATALTFARRGATVVLAARRKDVLRLLAEECEAIGGHSLVAPTDVTDAAAVANLAKKADEAFGGIDVWINNAGTGVVGAYTQADMALHRRTIEVNLLGTMNGTHAVLPTFIRQRRGVLINNISMAGWSPTPFTAAYTASKFGLRGFTASIRQELSAIPGIQACGVYPSMIDTPGLGHIANRSGRHLDPGPFLYLPEDVASIFLGLVRHPRAEVVVGRPSRAAQIGYGMAPALTERTTGAIFRYLFSRAQNGPNYGGSVRSSQPEGTASSGGWLARKGMPPAGQLTRIALIAGLITASAVAIGRARRSKSRCTPD